jgi:hypothetical protein
MAAQYIKCAAAERAQKKRARPKALPVCALQIGAEMGFSGYNLSPGTTVTLLPLPS